jgi:hypothetical protein
MSYSINETEWLLLLRRIKDGKCTPFLGAGACYGVLPLAREIAKDWSREHKSPMTDCDDLARVAQFLAVKFDPMFPKEELLKKFKGVSPPDFRALGEPHGILAKLPLPVYMTTNYDDFMVKALEDRNRDPKREFCRWNTYIKDEPSVFDTGFRPTVANPVVFHLHGHDEMSESIVLTEDDYLTFLVNISKDQNIIPPRILEAFTGSSLLFIGYSLADWDFRVLFQGLVNATDPNLRRISVTVQLPPTQKELQEYQEKYFGEMSKGMRVYWGTAKEFVAELKERWDEFMKQG